MVAVAVLVLVVVRVLGGADPAFSSRRQRGVPAMEGKAE